MGETLFQKYVFNVKPEALMGIFKYELDTIGNNIQIPVSIFLHNSSRACTAHALDVRDRGRTAHAKGPLSVLYMITLRAQATLPQKGESCCLIFVRGEAGGVEGAGGGRGGLVTISVGSSGGAAPASAACSRRR